MANVADKFIFEFHDGTRNRKCDVWKALMKIQAEIPLEVVLSGGSDGAGNAKLIDAFRRAIGVSEWTEENESGMTDGRALQVLQEFIAFVDAEKKSTEPTPTLPPSTAPEYFGSGVESNLASGST